MSLIAATALTLLPSRTPDITRKVGSALQYRPTRGPGFLRLNENAVVTALHFAARGFHQFQTPHWRNRICRIARIERRDCAIGSNSDFRPFRHSNWPSPRLSPDAPELSVARWDQPECCHYAYTLRCRQRTARPASHPAAMQRPAGARCNPSCRASCLHPVLTPLPACAWAVKALPPALHARRLTARENRA